MPISQDQITTLDQLEEKLTLALTDLLLLRDSNNEDYKVKASTILQAAVDKAGAELIGGNVESGNTKAVTGDTVNTKLSSYIKGYTSLGTTDFNEVVTTGFYRVEKITDYTNAPSGAASYGQLIVSRNRDTILQIYSGFGADPVIYYRCFNASLAQGLTWQELINRNTLTTALQPKQTIQTFTTPANKQIKLTFSHTNTIFAVKITIQGTSGYNFGSLQWQGYGDGTYDSIGEIMKGSAFSYTKNGNQLEITLPSVTSGFNCSIENIINGDAVTYTITEVS